MAVKSNGGQAEKRGRKPQDDSVESVGISLRPKLLAAIDRHCRQLGINRSEFGRRAMARELARIRRLGRPKYEEVERRKRTEEATPQLNTRD